MGKETLSLKTKLDETDERAAILREKLKQEFREKLIISSISGLALNQLDRPGRVAQNAILLADAVIAELGWK